MKQFNSIFPILLTGASTLASVAAGPVVRAAQEELPNRFTVKCFQQSLWPGIVNMTGWSLDLYEGSAWLTSRILQYNPVIFVTPGSKAAIDVSEEGGQALFIDTNDGSLGYTRIGQHYPARSTSVGFSRFGNNPDGSISTLNPGGWIDPPPAVFGWQTSFYWYACPEGNSTDQKLYQKPVYWVGADVNNCTTVNLAAIDYSRPGPAAVSWD